MGVSSPVGVRCVDVIVALWDRPRGACSCPPHTSWGLIELLLLVFMGRRDRPLNGLAAHSFSNECKPLGIYTSGIVHWGVTAVIVSYYAKFTSQTLLGSLRGSSSQCPVFSFCCLAAWEAANRGLITLEFFFSNIN